MAADSDSNAGPDTGRPDEPMAGRLVACSGDRTLVADLDRGELCKIYERGSMEDAEAEAGMGAMVATDGVVRYRGARRDPVTGRPCVLMDHHPGLDISQWNAKHGPLDPRGAARVGAALARTLSTIHAVNIGAAPRGVVHRDVKPTNVYLVGEDPDPSTAQVLLLDLEHATAAGTDGASESASTFSGGTHGYSPPEAYQGAAPAAPFDVFGIGATLHFMLTGVAPFSGADPQRVALSVRDGRRRLWYMAGQPAALQQLVNECLSHDPDARPSMAEVESRLQALASDDDEQHLDDALAAIQRGDLDGAAELLIPAGSERSRELEALLRRRRALVDRAEPPVKPAGDLGPRELAELTAATASRLTAWLARFPASSDALETRRALFIALDELLRTAPMAVAAHKRAGEFEQAVSLLESTMACVAATRPLPRGPLSAADAADPALRSPIHREPLRLLQLTLRDVEEATRTYTALVEQIKTAEARIDLEDVHRSIDSTTTQYGGASPIVARLKDRAYRLGFFLERISQPVPTLKDLHEQLIAADLDPALDPIREFQSLCAERTRGQEVKGHATRQNSLRVLHRVLHDLLDEFPHTEAVAGPAVDTLDRAMESLTDECWDLAEDARKKLEAQPIPVRPLQMIVHRLDAFRRLEVVIDRPDRPSLDLLNEHERLRLEVDQARTARDHLARGAEAAMERGHWTTALYDMGRAVDRLSGDTGEIEQDRERLIEQLEIARRTKDEIDTAASENVRLAAHYATLEADQASTLDARTTTLEQRREVLRFLTEHLPSDRAAPYHEDLATLQLTLAALRASNAAELLATMAGDERDRVARETSAALRAGIVADAANAPHLRELLERWERELERTSPPVTRIATMLGEQQRRRSLVGMVLVVIALVAVIALVFKSF